MHSQYVDDAFIKHEQAVALFIWPDCCNKQELNKVVDDEAQALPLGSHIKTKHVDAEPSMPEKSYYWLPERYDTLSPIAWDQALKVVANLFAFGFETDGIATNELLPESIFNN